MRSGSREARRTANKTFIHDRYFEKVFGERPGLQVVIVCLADAAQETHWAWPAKLELEHGEHESFCLQNLIDSVAPIDHVYDLLNRRAVDLLILSSYENSCCSDKLQFA